MNSLSFHLVQKSPVRSKLDQTKRLKELEKENTKLKRLVAELSLENEAPRLHSRPARYEVMRRFERVDGCDHDSARPDALLGRTP